MARCLLNGLQYPDDASLIYMYCSLPEKARDYLKLRRWEWSKYELEDRLVELYTEYFDYCLEAVENDHTGH